MTSFLKENGFEMACFIDMDIDHDLNRVNSVAIIASKDGVNISLKKYHSVATWDEDNTEEGEMLKELYLDMQKLQSESSTAFFVDTDIFDKYNELLYAKTLLRNGDPFPFQIMDISTIMKTKMLDEIQRRELAIIEDKRCGDFNEFNTMDRCMISMIALKHAIAY